jgi:uncharacterized protein (TIGR02001 family)
MKKTLLSLSIAAAAVTMPTQAADIGSGLDLSGNVSLTSMYIWRGQDQNDDAPAVQGGLDLAHESGLYVGTWMSPAWEGTEVDIYAGFATELAGFGVDVGVIEYMYPGETGPDFTETYLGISKDLGGVELGATYSWGDELTDNVEFSAGTEISGIGVSAVYGDYDNTGDYMSLGVSKEIVGYEFSLTYTDFDADAGSASDQDDIVFAVSKSF